MVFKIASPIIEVFIQMTPYLMLGLFVAGVLHIFISRRFVSRHIGSDSVLAIFKSALLGVPLPLCSCGVIPTSVSLRKSGASPGATVSFLISTPQTGIDSIIATYGLLGPVFAVYRPLAALVMGFVGGVAVRFFGKKEPPGQELGDSPKDSLETAALTLPRKCLEVFRYAYFEFLGDIVIQLIAGIIIAGLISFFLPAGFFAGIGSGLTGMLLMLAAGIPMYICATASIPIAVALMLKGVSPGGAFVFLAAGPATNAASLMVLFHVLGRRTTLIYLAVIAVLSVAFGFLLDGLIGLFHWDVTAVMKPHAHATHLTPFDYGLSIVFALLLVVLLARRLNPRRKKAAEETGEGNLQKISIQGMTCSRCAANVQKAIQGVNGVKTVRIDLAGKAAYVRGRYNADELARRVFDVGYRVSNS